jgi:hypothetical protein
MTRRAPLVGLFFLVVGLGCAECLARADTYYVAVDGSDGAAGSQSALALRRRRSLRD